MSEATPTSGRTDRQAAQGLVRTGDSSCPRRLVNKRCRGNECWCKVTANDHGGSYTDVKGRRTVIWEPYEVFDSDLATVLTGCWDDGLFFYFANDSTYWPSRTMAVHFYRKEDL